MKKLISSIIICLLLGSSVAHAQLGGGITSPTFFKKNGNNINFLNSLYELCSSSQRCVKIWADVLDVTTIIASAIGTGAITITADSANALLVETAANAQIFNVDTVTPLVTFGTGTDAITAVHNTTDGLINSLSGLLRLDAPNGTILMHNGVSVITALNDAARSILLANSGDYLSVGDATATSRGLNNNDSLLVTDDLEVDGIAYLDNGSTFGGQMTVEGGVEISIAGGGTIKRLSDIGLAFMPNGVDTQDNNHVVFIKAAYKGDALGLDPVSTNTRVYFFSNADPDVDNQKRGYIGHDQADFVFHSDTGDIRFDNGFAVERIGTAVSANTAGETIVGVTDTSIARTITLDADDVKSGHIFIIKDESGAAGTNNITIDTEGAENIDGVASIAITANYGVARLYSDGTNWFTI